MKRVLLALLTLSMAAMACAIPVRSAEVVVLTGTPNATETALPTQTETPNAWTALVRLPVVNVRESPGGKVIGSLSVGDTVTIDRCDGDWCKVTEPIKGYVFKGCLSLDSGLGCAAK
jgi:hypothetical protein